MVQVGRGRHSGFLFSGVTKPLRAYVDPNRVCLYWRFCFVGFLVFVRIQFCVSLFLVYNVRPIKARTCLLRNKVFNEQRHYKGPDVFSKVRLSIHLQRRLTQPLRLFKSPDMFKQESV